MARKNRKPIAETTQKNALIPLYILEILKKEKTTVNDRRTIQEIWAALKDDYDVHLKPRAVSRYARILAARGLAAQPEGRNGYYYCDNLFEEEELQTLLYCVACNQNLSLQEARTLFSKLTNQLEDKLPILKSLVATSRFLTEEPGMSENVNRLHNAIQRSQIIRFSFCRYGVDGRLAPAEEVVFYPVLLQNKGGHMTVSGYDEGRGEYLSYPLDWMRDIEVAGGSAKKGIPEEFVKEKRFDRIYEAPESPRETTEIVFQVRERHLNEVVEYFGEDITQMKASRQDREVIEVRVAGETRVLERWLMGHMGEAEAIFPPAFRKRMQQCIAQAAEIYDDERRAGK